MTRTDLNQWSREELQRALEERGFAVYDSESTEDLREAVYLDQWVQAEEES